MIIKSLKNKTLQNYEDNKTSDETCDIFQK